jgi:mannose-6-phosphate isomerase
MNLFFSAQVSKPDVFTQVRSELSQHNFTIVNEEFRPWGGFFVIKEDQAEKFLDVYFSSLNKNEVFAKNKLSPKILIVETGKRLSWQYHHRRAEIWKVIGGIAGVVKSDSDEENEIEKYNNGDIIELKKGERHRLVGLDSWGIIAEIWQHTDINHPSNEDDIVRLNDDFGR